MLYYPLLRLHQYSNQLSLVLVKNLKKYTTMELKPPESVYLMTTLNRNVFDKPSTVPLLHIGNTKVSSILPIIKKLLLKMENFKPITHDDDKGTSIYLNPEIIKNWTDLPEDVRQSLEELNVQVTNFKLEEITLKYENFSSESIFKAVLPKDKEGVSSFTKVGHIVHVNLREHLLDYKNLIGEVLLDKVKGCKSVVNKLNMIDNTYRYFQMEVLKGTDNMLTTLKENNCKFEFDFSTVYWNSRLCTEHERIVKALNPGDILFDVFAGVGPFSIPAAKKNCIVYANDLNPESYKWLIHNKKLNKVSDDCFKGFNLDGREFILKIIKENLRKYVDNKHQIVVTMNLPAMAVEFLDAFIGLFEADINPITLYVYCFAKGENPEEIARNLIKENFKIKNVDIDSKITDIFRVRTVSSMKEMMRVTLKLDRDILVGVPDDKKRKSETLNEDVQLKKSCIDKNGQEQEEKQQCVQSSRSQEFKNEIQS
ncbi:unnamed protein product [Ceutorhynchus assimilis]|uniref:tRNA (guanine(37)-N1)-methyltransferase n=1 Tax=Ceutorhynchus assimilis TaxID=467358 RepID=A0A9P0GSB8_9CUCU|nr:unnamed protein product [Ceutorhynchus assimilis]